MIAKRWYVGLAYGLAGGWGMLIGLLQLGVGLVMVSSGWWVGGRVGVVA